MSVGTKVTQVLFLSDYLYTRGIRTAYNKGIVITVQLNFKRELHASLAFSTYVY